MISNLQQYKNNETVAIPNGTTTLDGVSNNILIKADLRTPLGQVTSSQLQMFVEVREVNEDFVNTGSLNPDIVTMAADPINGTIITNGS